MKARPHPATLAEMTPAPPCNFSAPRRLKNPKVDITPRNFVDNSLTGYPSKLLKKQGRGKKVSNIRVPPCKFMQTQGAAK